MAIIYVAVAIVVWPLGSSLGFEPQYSTLVTAIVALATIAFVLYPTDFVKVSENISRGGKFAEQKNSLMLSIINILFVILVTVFLAGAYNIINGSIDASAKRKIDIVCIICGIEMMAIFIAYLWMQASRARSQNSSNNQGPVL